MRVLYGLVALFAGVLVILLVYGTGSHHASSFTERTDAEAGQAQQSSPDLEAMETEPKEAAVVTPVRSVDNTRNGTVGEEHRSSASFVGEGHTTPSDRINEDVARRVRASAAKGVGEAYSLIFEELGLTQQDKDELFSLLVEVQMGGMSIYHRGKPAQLGMTMDEDERSGRIAGIIGYPKLKQFLALERNTATYSEAYRMGSLLERKGVPLTEAQRDGLVDILAASRNRDYAPMPSGHIERYSLEQLERTMTRMNERERHVIQLAPSVLSPQQVAYLHERYQSCSYERADDLERQKQQRADHPSEPRPVSYRPCGP